MYVDLITGFLGAGKTTFLKGYYQYFARKGENIRIIENEFGPVNVDTRLLAEVSTDIEDLAGCCMCCTGKDRFRQMLLLAAEEGYNRVLVEPSGIYDVDEFFALLDEEHVREHCSIGSILAIVDAKLPNTISEESAYLMAGQLLAAGAVIMSKSQLYDEETVLLTERALQEMSPVPFVPVIRKDWSTFTEEDYAYFASCGCHRGRHKHRFFDHKMAYGCCMIGKTCLDERDLEERMERLFADPAYGMVIRVKGKIRDASGKWYDVNCTEESRQIREGDSKRGLLVVIGQELKEEKLNEAFSCVLFREEMAK